MFMDFYGIFIDFFNVFLNVRYCFYFIFYGISMDLVCSFNELFMGFLWDFYGLLWDFYGIPMFFLNGILWMLMANLGICLGFWLDVPFFCPNLVHPCLNHQFIIGKMRFEHLKLDLGLVVRRERFGAFGVSIFPTHIPYEQWGAIRSYLEFSNHLIATNHY